MRLLDRSLTWLILTTGVAATGAPLAQSGVATLLQFSLEELAQVTVSGVTLFGTTRRKTPASVTTITARDISLSGARDLDELLDIYVPGFQYMNKAQAPMMGIRGIINDRNNKILMLVNGRNMNVKGADGGAITERLLSTLGDIKKIDVIRAPGSATLGPGAIAGIISIETQSGADVDGFEIALRGGINEKFGSGEIKFGKTFDNGMSAFAYFGIDDYDGAHRDDSPLIFSQSFTTEGGRSIVAGEPSDHPGTNHYRASLHQRLRRKAHFQLAGNGISLNARYTRGGLHGQSTPRIFARDADEFLFNHGTGYEQILLSGDYEVEVSDDLKIKYHASFDTANVQIGEMIHHWREDEYVGGVRAFMAPNEHHRFTVGAEVSYEQFGKKSSFVPDLPSDINNDIPFGTEWNTTMYSLFAEEIWEPNDLWTLIGGLRVDKHRFTPYMWSPRFALVATPNEQDTVKLIVNRSVRRPDDADLFRANLGDRKVLGDVERIHHYEVRYERQQSSSSWLAGTAFYNDHRVVSWDPNARLTDAIGDIQSYGLEFEARIKTLNLGLQLSHSFTKLIDFDNTRSISIQGISSAPYGYGNDLINWSNHSTKLSFDYTINPHWTIMGSLRAYWGYPGAIDLADYNAAELGEHQGFALYDDSKRAFEESVHLNLGAEYRPNDNTSVKLHAYNILGIFDDELNKRNTLNAVGMYRVEPPAAALSVNIRF